QIAVVGLRRDWFSPGRLVARFRFRVHVPARQHLGEVDGLHLTGLPRVFRQTDLAMAPVLLGSGLDQLANLRTLRLDADHVADHETAIRHPPELEPNGVGGLCGSRRGKIPCRTHLVLCWISMDSTNFPSNHARL